MYDYVYDYIDLDDNQSDDQIDFIQTSDYEIEQPTKRSRPKIVPKQRIVPKFPSNSDIIQPKSDDNFSGDIIDIINPVIRVLVTPPSTRRNDKFADIITTPSSFSDVISFKDQPASGQSSSIYRNSEVVKIGFDTPDLNNFGDQVKWCKNLSKIFMNWTNI